MFLPRSLSMTKPPPSTTRTTGAVCHCVVPPCFPHAIPVVGAVSRRRWAQGSNSDNGLIRRVLIGQDRPFFPRLLGRRSRDGSPEVSHHWLPLWRGLSPTLPRKCLYNNVRLHSTIIHKRCKERSIGSIGAMAPQGAVRGTRPELESGLVDITEPYRAARPRLWLRSWERTGRTCRSGSSRRDYPRQT